MKTPQYQRERNAALEEIREAMTDRIRALALSPLGSNKGNLSLPDYLNIQEAFRWPALVVTMAAELEQGLGLRNVFARVARPVQGDLQASYRSGRDSAFDDILKALEIAERDFDATYKPLDKEQIRYWQKKHPLEPQHLELAYKENQRARMKEAIAETKAILDLLRGQPPKSAGPSAPGRRR